MGTNYYLHNKKQLESEPIHMCKMSCGWKPLFQSNDLYRTYSGLSRLINNNTHYEIIDEYDNKWSWKDFDKKVKLFQKNTKTHKIHSYYDPHHFEFTDMNFS